MTRSKELRRIERAIEHRDEAELRWALSYIEMRKKLLKKHSDLWFRMERDVRKALNENG